MGESHHTIGGKYRLGKRIGQGSFGKCYLAVHLQTGEEVAVKLEPAKTKNPQLLAEAKLFQHLGGGLGVPNVHWFGQDGEHNAMAIDLLGKSLEDLFKDVGKRFSAKTVCMLGDQIVNRLEYMHSKSTLHRDVKPDNFVMGLPTGPTAKLVHVIDFGLSKKYRHQKTLVHVAYNEKSQLTGTARYASINTHLNVEQSRRDDLESVAYMLLYFVRGGLPWQGLKANSKKEKYQKILARKMSMPIEMMCGPAPEEIGTFLVYCRRLRFEEKPDYEYLRKLLRSAMSRSRLPYDLKFDWDGSVANGSGSRPGSGSVRRDSITEKSSANSRMAESSFSMAQDGRTNRSSTSSAIRSPR